MNFTEGSLVNLPDGRIGQVMEITPRKVGPFRCRVIPVGSKAGGWYSSDQLSEAVPTVEAATPGAVDPVMQRILDALDVDGDVPADGHWRHAGPFTVEAATDLGPKSFPEIVEEYEAARGRYCSLDTNPLWPLEAGLRECFWCHEDFTLDEPTVLLAGSWPSEVAWAGRFCSATCQVKAGHAGHSHKDPFLRLGLPVPTPGDLEQAVPERRVVGTSQATVNEAWATAKGVWVAVKAHRNGMPVTITMDGGHDIVKTLIDGGGKTYRLELVEVEE